MGTTWELRTATPVPRPIQYTEMDLRNKTTSELRTVFHIPLGVPNSQVPLYSIMEGGLRHSFFLYLMIWSLLYNNTSGHNLLLVEYTVESVVKVHPIGIGLKNVVY